MFIAPAVAFSGGQQGADDDTLRVSMAPPGRETNRIWTDSWANLGQFSPTLETLVDMDPETGEFIPGLATDWEASDDLREWTFYLREGVRFHYGWGEFTAADVKHTYELLSRPDSGVNMAATWRDDIDRVELIDDYTVRFHFNRPWGDGEELFSMAGGELYIVSKDHWDQEGQEEAMDDQLVGTGPYKLVNRVDGASMTVELFEDHWADYDIEFPRIVFSWVDDEQTRLSQLLSGEADITELSREVANSAEAQGMDIITSSVVSMQRMLFFGGQYFHPDGPDPHDTWHGGENPLADVAVREALTRAVDLDLIHQELYHGRVEPVARIGFTPLQEGWNAEWEENYEDDYGYDPELAVEILREAGWEPSDVEIRINLHNPVAQPEAISVLEAIASMWNEIGIDVTIVPMDFGSLLDRWFTGNVQSEVFNTRNLPIRTTEQFIFAWHTEAAGTARLHTTEWLDEQLRALVAAGSEKERQEIAEGVGDYLYDNYVNINLGATFDEAIVNPARIEDWTFPGRAPGGKTHYHFIKRAD